MPARTQTIRLAGAAVAATLMLTACSGGGEDQPEAGAPLETIEIMAPVIASSAPDPEGTLQTEIEEFSGKDLEITWVPNANYADRMNVVMASDDIPHAMVVQGKTGSFVQSAEAGAFWDLTDHLEDFPNLQPSSEDIRLAASVNGRSYGMYRPRDPMRTAVIVRKDWLTNLGLEEPENTDDLREIARAFTEDDPDGNGQDDTTGIIIPSWPGGYGSSSPYDVVETWFGAPNKWGVDDGNLYPAFESEAFMEANAYMRDMVENGYINADFATMDPGNWNDPFFNGQGGIIIDVSSRAVEQLMTLFREAHPDDYDQYLAMTGNLAGPDGELNAYPTAGFSGMVAIPKASVPTEDMLNEVLGFFDKMSTPEGQILLNNGIEDVNFEVVDGKAAAIESDDPDVAAIRNDVMSFAQIGVASGDFYLAQPRGEFEAELNQERLDFHAADLEQAVYDPAAALVSPTYVQNGAVLDQIITDARIQYLAGQIDEAGLRAEIERWRASGGDDVVAEMNELYSELDN